MRLLSVSNLVATEAKYHSSCRTKFEKTLRSHSTPECPTLEKKMAPFLSVCHKLEEEIELTSEFHKGMEQLGDDIYSVKMTKAKLIDKYGNSIRFVNRRNRSNIIPLENVRYTFCKILKHTYTCIILYYIILYYIIFRHKLPLLKFLMCLPEISF